MKTKTIILLVAICSIAPLSRAVTINFGSQVPSSGTYSNSAPWLTDGSYQIEVGAFSSGFTPTSLNVSQWLENWNLANMEGPGVTTWLDDGGDTSFTGGGGYSNNTGAWAIGSQIYLWGFNSRAIGTNQWILLQNTAVWLTVDSNVITPQTLQTFDLGTSAVVGSINGAGDAFQSAAVLVVPEPATWISLCLGLAVLLGVSRRTRPRASRV